MKLFQLFIALWIFVYGVASDGCEQLANPLELVFLIDRSSSTVLRASPRIIEVIDELQYEYRRPLFGLSFYSDFQCSDWETPEKCSTIRLEDGLLHHTDPEGCYTFHTGLSKDTNVVKNALQDDSIEQLPSGNGESGIAALMMLATDPNVNWSNGTTKVVFIVTDDSTHYGAYFDKLPPKGDGTDRCSTMENPSLEFTSAILEDKGISIFLVLANGGSRQDTYEGWTNALDNTNIHYGIANISDTTDVIANQFRSFILSTQ